MASKIEIINKALQMLGQEPLPSADVDSVAARRAQSAFDSALEALLRSFPWPFAIKRANLERSAETPAYHWKYYYRIPADCMFLVSTSLDRHLGPYGRTTTYSLEGPYIATNADNVSITYASDAVEITRIDALAERALVHLLASDLAVPLLDNDAMRQNYAIAYQQILAEARSMKSLESHPSRIPDGSWIGARRGWFER